MWRRLHRPNVAGVNDSKEQPHDEHHRFRCPRPGAVKERQQQAWASGDFARRRGADPARGRAPLRHRRPAAPAGASSTSPPAAATPPSLRRGTAARSSASTTCRPCSSAGRMRAAAEGLDVDSWTATPRRCRSPTAPSTRSPPSSARCSRPTTRGRPPSCSGSAAPAARSPWRAGRRTASSATSSARSRQHVPPPAGRAVADALGHRGPPARAVRRAASRSLETAERTFTFRFRSAEEFVDFFRIWYGPTLKAFAALEDDAATRSSRTWSRSRGAATGSAPGGDRDPGDVHRGRGGDPLNPLRRQGVPDASQH